MSDALKFATYWQGRPDSVEALGANTFRFISGSNWYVLKLMNERHHNFQVVTGEIDFLLHLNLLNAPIVKPIASNDKRFIVQLDDHSGQLAACFSMADGVFIDEDSPFRNEDFYFSWGKNLAEIHLASKFFKPRLKRRQHWYEEACFQAAPRTITLDDKPLREEYNEVIQKCMILPKGETSYGMIHANHQPRNFKYNPQTGQITAFDFTKCHYHFYLADLEMSLSTLHDLGLKTARQNIIEGYFDKSKIPRNLERSLELFTRLRKLALKISELSSHRSFKKTG